MPQLSETLVGGFSTKETAEMLYVLKRMRGLDVDGAKSTPRCIVLRQGSDPTVFDKKDD